MTVFVVTWNLNRENNYAASRAEFIKHLERYPNVADPGLESVRWIDSSSDAPTISDDLRTKMDKNDCLFVSRISSGGHQGWLSQSTWDWINARL